MMGPQTINDIQQVLRVAELQSFSKAAEVLGVSTAAVSATVKRLEASLAIRLFERTTRKVRLTSEGQFLMQQYQGVMDLLDQAHDQVQQTRDRVSGTIAIGAPADLARTLVSDWITLFQHQNPDIRIDLRVTDQLSNLHQEPIDVAIRYGEPNDSTLISRPLLNSRRVLCASPEYLQKQGEPRGPRDLMSHNCLCYRLSGSEDNRWAFFQQGQEYLVQVKGNLVVDDTSLARQWALAGEGLVYKSELDVYVDLQQGRLVHLLRSFEGQPSPLYLVYPGAVNLPLRSRMLVDFLLAQVSRISLAS